MEEAVPCNDVVANDDFVSKSILSIDAVVNKPTFKDVGTTTMFFSLVLITEIPIYIETSVN